MHNASIMSRPFKVKLSDKASSELGKVVAEMQSERGNYQIGVGTIAAELIERLISARPDLIQTLLEGGGHESSEAASKHAAPKKAGDGNRKRAA